MKFCTQTFCTTTLAGLLLLAGCQAIQRSTTTTDTVTTASDTTGEAVEIRFALKAGDQDLSCAQPATDLGTTQSTVQLNDLRFYVSNLALIDGSGNAVPVVLEQDGLWQVESTALLDFEDGSAGCTETGNPDLKPATRI